MRSTSSTPRHIIVAAELIDAVRAARPASAAAATIWSHGGAGGLPRIDEAVDGLSPARLGTDAHRAPTVADAALVIYTSGTTGLPKAANVSHFRVMHWSHWFAGMMDTAPATGCTIACRCITASAAWWPLGAVLVNGGSVVIATAILGAASSGTMSSRGTARCSSISASFAATCVNTRRSAGETGAPRSGCAAATG